MRDYEYIVNHLQPPFAGSKAHDFLEKTSSTFPKTAMRSSVSTFLTPKSITSRLRDMLKRRLPKQLSYAKSEKVRSSSAYVCGEPPQLISTTVELFAGGIIALRSTVVMITPIVIMAFAPSTAKSLVTLSTAVLVFYGFFDKG
jgi:hypothetical protein